jgi:Transposase.
MTTNPPQIVFKHIVAFEVSKEKLVVHTLPDDEQWTIDNKPQAVRRLIKAEIKRNRKKQLGQMLVICEATGGYERHVLDVALEMGLSVHRAHGTRVRHFGHYRGLLAKTDPIDAHLIAQYGLKTENLRLYSPPPPIPPHCVRSMPVGRRSSRCSSPRPVALITPSTRAC